LYTELFHAIIPTLFPKPKEHIPEDEPYIAAGHMHIAR